MLPSVAPAVHAECHEGVDQGEDREHLEQQQDVFTQPLKEAVHVQVLDALFPEERAGHLERLAFQF